MKNIKIFGSGCRNCKMTYANVEKVVKETGTDAAIVKEENIAEIVKHGIMSTPAVMIDGTIVHAGGVPDEIEIRKWFE